MLHASFSEAATGMIKNMLATQPSQLLNCEACGYDLTAVEDTQVAGKTSVCPECGEPVANSLPQRRSGTYWQNRPGLFPLVCTWYDVLRHPTRTFRKVRIEKRHAWKLLVINSVITAFLLADPWVGVLAGDPVRAARGGEAELLIKGIGYAAYTLLITLAIIGLTLIEIRGVRFFSNRHGWKLSENAALQVCAHASVGWIFCGLLSLLGMATMTALALKTKIIPQTHLDLTPIIPVRVMWHDALGFVFVVGGYLLGMVIFETLAYVGVRQCRFANAPTRK